jgi:hypothetical protein
MLIRLLIQGIQGLCEQGIVGKGNAIGWVGHGCVPVCDQIGTIVAK